MVPDVPRAAAALWRYPLACNTGACAFDVRHGFRAVAVARGFEPAWNVADVRYEWRRGT